MKALVLYIKKILNVKPLSTRDCAVSLTRESTMIKQNKIGYLQFKCGIGLC